MKTLTFDLEADVPLIKECLQVLNARNTEDIPKLLEKDILSKYAQHFEDTDN